MKRIFFISIILLILSVSGLAQNSRVISLGGLTYSITDPDYSVNPYDFGNNPAWLINDEKTSFLKITPCFKRTWGDYKKLYDFGSTDKYGTEVEGIRTLGESGTFYGYAAYSYEQRENVFKSLKYDTYAGEAFYTLDSVNGNFRYNGPAIGFSYSYELMPGLFFGASVNYSLSEGLRKTYSGAKALIREVNGKAGAAYKITDNSVLGAACYLFDSQESLEMQNLDGSDVIVYNFRGDKYFIQSRKSLLNQKIRKKGKGFDGQFYLTPSDKFELGVYGDYNTSGTYILIPQDYLKEFEEGFADFENYSIKTKIKYSVTDNLQLGAAADYFNNSSWSKNSSRNLLLWKWNLNGPSLGIGGSYYFSSCKLLLGAEYEISYVKADSSKYIDTKFVNVSSLNNYLRFGMEFEAAQGTFIRAGYNFEAEQNDFINGGKDVRLNSISIGLGYKIAEKADFDIGLYYNTLSPGYSNGYFRNKINLYASIKLLSF